MNANIVKVKIGKNVLDCAISLNYTGPPLCNDTVLKEYNGKITRIISSVDKLNYKEFEDQAIGWTILPLVFTSNVDINRLKSKDKSITIMTEVLVERDHHISTQHILLGLDWFTGRKCQHSELQNYRPVFVTEAENGYLRSTLHITNLKSPKKEKVVMNYHKGVSSYWPMHNADITSDDESDTDYLIKVRKKDTNEIL